MKYDLLLQAKNGTGKTCVFTVCILEQVRLHEQGIQALVVAPLAPHLPLPIICTTLTSIAFYVT